MSYFSGGQTDEEIFICPDEQFVCPEKLLCKNFLMQTAKIFVSLKSDLKFSTSEESNVDTGSLRLLWEI